MACAPPKSCQNQKSFWDPPTYHESGLVFFISKNHVLVGHPNGPKKNWFKVYFPNCIFVKCMNPAYASSKHCASIFNPSLILQPDGTWKWNGWFRKTASRHWWVPGKSWNKIFPQKSQILTRMFGDVGDTTFDIVSAKFSTNMPNLQLILKMMPGGFCPQCWRDGWCCCLRPPSHPCQEDWSFWKSS